MEGRLLYFEGSEAAHLVRQLPGPYERVPLAGSARDGIEITGSAVLIADATAGELPRALALKAAHPRLELIVLTDSAALSSVPPEQVYAYLVKPVTTPIMAKTLANAFAHSRLREEHERTRAHLLRATTELHELNTIGIKLSAERDTDALLRLILTKAREITQSDAGSLYLVEEDEAGSRRLRFILVQNDSISVPFEEFTLPVNSDSVAGHVALTGRVLNLEDAYSPPPRSPFTIDRAFDQQVGYRTKSMLVVPMKTPKDEVIGVLQLINCKTDRGRRFTSPDEVERDALPFSTRFEELASSLASQAAVALENSRLYQSIRTLFEGFVKASVVAIESRDPTTSGHSFRVADLTVGLAEVVDRLEGGPYAAVRFTPQELKEIRYASLLHDFGKVGVREEVLVKAKKLYPTHLDLIKQRVELIKRGLALKYSQKKIEYLLAEGRERFIEQSRIFDAELMAALRELDADLASVVSANEPSIMRDDFAAAVQRIALRSFEDHLGVAHAVITPQEARVLSIPKGSLTEAERAQIESHVIHTFQFLVQIPWTKELRRLPEIARSHHEKLNGSGYPYGMKGEEIPLQSRMMTISDIYDALTAADRPYKKALAPERALDILKSEAKAGLIDPALLGFFINAKVYEQSRPRA